MDLETLIEIYGGLDIEDDFFYVENHNFILKVAYDSIYEVLFVVFTNQRVYAYLDITAQEHVDFLKSASKGKFFNQTVKQHAYFELVPGNPKEPELNRQIDEWWEELKKL